MTQPSPARPMELLWLALAEQEAGLDERDRAFLATADFRRASSGGVATVGGAVDGRPNVPGVVLLAVHVDGGDGEITRHYLPVTHRWGAAACVRALLSAWPDLLEGR